MVLAILALVVFAIGRVVGGGDDSAAAVSTSSNSGHQRSGQVDQKQGNHGKGNGDPGGGHHQKSPQTRDQPLPDGVCEPGQIQLTPVVADGVRVGQSVAIQIALRTTGRPACSLALTPDNLVVDVTTSKGDPVWTSDECSAAITPTSLVVRAASATILQVTWDGTRSDARCSASTVRSAAGDYLVRTAIIGGEPAESPFTLAAALPTQTTPSASPSSSPSSNQSSSPSSGQSPGHT
jgi:hypothetical protein